MNVVLNVQGQIFETKYETLIKIPYFKDMFETCGPPKEIIFIDRPSHIFKHILSLTVNPFYKFPEKYVSELDFYCIDLKEITLYNKIPDKLMKLCDLNIEEKVDALYRASICDYYYCENLRCENLRLYNKKHCADHVTCERCGELTYCSESKYCYDHANEYNTFCELLGCTSKIYRDGKCEYHCGL
jgi:hypothetical protein